MVRVFTRTSQKRESGGVAPLRLRLRSPNGRSGDVLYSRRSLSTLPLSLEVDGFPEAISICILRRSRRDGEKRIAPIDVYEFALLDVN
uniref:Uncharacterized protein n=1 Tax=Steinernema glaseri TaxID=37863 RepID=A0A1I7YZG1_9BILA